MIRRSLLGAIIAITFACAIQTSAAESGVRGNPKSNKFHYPSCIHYKSKGATQKFKSDEMARRAGFVSCKICAKSKDASKQKTPAKKPPAKKKTADRKKAPDTTK